MERTARLVPSLPFLTEAPREPTLQGVVQAAGTSMRDEGRWRRHSVHVLMMPDQSPTDRSAREVSSPTAPTPSSALSPATGQSPSSSAIWDRMRTVELPDEEHRAAQEEQRMTSRSGRCWWWMQGWLLAIGVGAATSITGAIVDFGIDCFSSVRFGFCTGQPFASHKQCVGNLQWIDWGEGWASFSANVALGTVMAAMSALLVYVFAPTASGSGIPEAKTILNGFVMLEVVSVRTLLVKIPGLILSVAAGMAVGKAAPLVHIALCWAQLLSRLSPQYQNEARRRELFSAAVAAGIGTAFGAPLGGVLYSLEEVSSFFPTRTLIRAFTAAMSAALTLSLLKGTDTHGLTAFTADYNTGCASVENVAFIILGALGGVLGAGFNALNLRWSKTRMELRAKWLNPIVEVALTALLTLITSWPLLFTRLLSADIIHALFWDCELSPGSDVRSVVGLCTPDGEYATASPQLLLSLAGAGLIRLLQTMLTFGTACPAGLIVPLVFSGACLGRCMGVVVQALGSLHPGLPQNIEPGVYSMVGAAAVLGGVTRQTISLVAIMLELTGGMDYIVPFMLAVLVAKIVGDAFGAEGINDLHIVLKGYPFLGEEVNVTFHERCCDIMDTNLTILDVSLRPRLADIRSLLQNFAFRGFPVVNGIHFIGYAKRYRLQAMVDNLANSEPPRAEDAFLTLMDLRPYIDDTVMRMAPDASLAQAHKVFTQLGCRNVFLAGSKSGSTAQDVLQGILSKKKFIAALKSGAVGHMANQAPEAPAQRTPPVVRSVIAEARLRFESPVKRSHRRTASAPNSAPRHVEAQPEGAGRGAATALLLEV